ncbi:MAG: 50S ribosomal protein L28 [Bacteroidales bacterium]|nr:50S ribosomal protein L28 [Bacteroidales bacterium]MDD2569914.1 50S ribosomal protein L28 [Bacteroidales bacterium]MDD2813147.1 50S ribosomal protein L28 [Bacteroidales bacterium]MDD3385061.1 50S ribosomal protein L28 [Bacteroidales bacterium]MDD3812463.1 50S ribosomal protein L28 [Bacteroidales bacterium]
MSKLCQITGKTMMVGNHVSHSNRRVKRRFYPNLFTRRFYLPEEDRWIVLKVSAAGMRTIDKKGLSACLKEAKAKGYINKY